MKKIAIIYTTFLRDKLMYKTVQAIFDNWKEDYLLLIADQGPMTEEKDTFLKELIRHYDKEAILTVDIQSDRVSIVGKKFHYYQLNFDCGLSMARNYLVKVAQKYELDYSILLADSLKINKVYDFNNIMSFFTENPQVGIIGLDDVGRPSWERDIFLVENRHFYLPRAKALPMQYKDMTLQRVEICRNFFIAKTQCLIDNPWDDNLKMAEHEDFFWRLKKDTKWEVYYTNAIQCAYIDEKPPEYQDYRNRLYGEFITKLREKYNLTGWVKYEK